MRFFLFVTLSFYSSSTNAQNSDLEAQFSYKQGEDALAKEDFSTCVKYCEKAASLLGKTNQKILFLQFQSYSGQLKKDCTAQLLSDKNKIDTYLKYYFDNFSTTTDQNKLFEVMKFRDDWNEFKTNGCKEPKYLHPFNFGIISIRDYGDYSGFMGNNIVVYISDKNALAIPDSKYINTSIGIASYTINGKTTYTDGKNIETDKDGYKNYIFMFDKDLKEAQKSGVEKINISLDVYIIPKNNPFKKKNETTLTGSILNPISK